MNELQDFFMDVYWSLLEIPTGLMMGDRGWARLRFLGLILIFIGFITLGGMIWEGEALTRTVLNWQMQEPALQNVPAFLLRLVAVFFTWESLRYLILPLAALVGALFWGSLYVQDIYELKSSKLAFRYLLASVFGFGYPYLVIEEGKKQGKVGEENSLAIIGGPGYVVVRPGNVVLFESLRNPWGVAAAGTHFISRFQTIKEITDLRDQHDTIEKLEAVTKDGFKVAAKDIHYRYRIWSSRRDGSRAGRTTSDPYPFSIQAVRNMTYQRAVTSEGVTSWRDTVRKVFEGEIQNYIRRNQVDQVTAPRNFEEAPSGRLRGNPRQDIHNIYRSPELRRKFREAGAELLWYGIGHFEVENTDLNDQRVATWQAEWRGDAKKMLAFSEAKKLAYIEQGRAEAQAEILMSIVHAMNDIGVTADPSGQRVREIFLFRVAQLLEAIQKEESNQLPSES